MMTEKQNRGLLPNEGLFLVFTRTVLITVFAGLVSGVLAAGEMSKSSLMAEEKNTESIATAAKGGDELSAELSKEVEAVFVLQADSDYGEYLANECSACHSPKQSESNAVPNIYGVDKKRIIANLLKYREGVRDNTTMVGVAKALSNEDVAALATYLADYQP